MFGSWGMMQPRMVDERLALAGREGSVLPDGAALLATLAERRLTQLAG